MEKLVANDKKRVSSSHSCSNREKRTPIFAQKNYKKDISNLGLRELILYKNVTFSFMRQVVELYDRTCEKLGTLMSSPNWYCMNLEILDKLLDDEYKLTAKQDNYVYQIKITIDTLGKINERLQAQRM